MANLSLGGTTTNVTPQIFETHPTSGQHRTHILKNKIIPNYLSKVYPSHVEFKTIFKFKKKMCFDVKNECIRKKKLGLSHEGFFLLGTQKRFFWGNCFWILMFYNTSNAKLLEIFYR